jgi:hypothetical protein
MAEGLNVSDRMTNLWYDRVGLRFYDATEDLNLPPSMEAYSKLLFDNAVQYLRTEQLEGIVEGLNEALERRRESDAATAALEGIGK